MRIKSTNYIIRAGVIAAIYFVLTILLKPISFGLIQFRIAEAMTILPLVEPAAIPGLAIGCLFANLAGSPFGAVDIIFGSLATLAAAYLTSKMPNKYLAVLPPIIINAVVVSIWVSIFTHTPYLVNVATIGSGEFVTAGIFGIVLLSVFNKGLD